MPSSTLPPMDDMYAPTGRPTPLDRCHGCNTPSSALLACDDFENGGTTNPGKRPRFCPNCMIGKKVRVFWPIDNNWYMGVVKEYDPVSGDHKLMYEDGDTEWVKIGESNTTAPPPSGQPTAGHGRTSSPHDAMDAVPPVSPAGHVIEPSDTPPHHSQPMYPSEKATVSPDVKWQGQPGVPPHPGYPAYSAGSMQSGSQPPPPGAHGGVYQQHMYHHGQPGHYPGYHSSHYAAHGMPYSYPPSVVGMPPGGMRGHEMDGPGKSHPLQQSPSPTSGSAGGSKRKSGPKAWTKEEDSLLLSIVQSMRMPMKWSIVAQSLPERTGKQCRERYVNHLNPRLKVTDWSPFEDATIFHLYNTIGSHWAKMSKMIPGRTDNGIKNRFHNLRRQLEREDEHRLRLSTARDFPEEIRLDRLREFPHALRGRAAELWDMKSGISVLAAQSVLGGSITRNAGRFGPFREADPGDVCVRCGLLIPSIHTGNEICTKTGWCQSCTRIPPHVSSNMLRECLNLRRAQDLRQREIIESWEEFFGPAASKSKETSIGA